MAAARRPRAPVNLDELSDESAFMQHFGLEELHGRLAQVELKKTYQEYIEDLRPAGDASGVVANTRAPSLATLYDSTPFGRPIKFFTRSQLLAAYSLKGKAGEHRLPPPNRGSAPPPQRAHTRPPPPKRPRLAPRASGAMPSGAAYADRRAAPGPRAVATTDYAGASATGLRALSTTDYAGVGATVLVPEVDALEAANPIKSAWAGGKHPFAVVITRENCRRLGIPHYFDVVSQPMDFQTVRSKALRGQYTSGAEFLLDLRLIVANAKAFNRPGDPIYTLAETVATAIDSMESRVLEAWDFEIRARQ